MEEFISKWSNWWTFSKYKKELDIAFEKELKELIKSEIEISKSPNEQQRGFK